MHPKIERTLRQAARNTLRLPSESQLVYDTLAPRGPGVMVDVGAHRGSALHPFAAAGWRVLAFEPDELNRRHLLHNVEGLGAVEVDPRAVSTTPGETVSIYRSSESAAISTLTPFVDTHVQAGVVTTTTLALACREHGVGEIDFLKVDTEGYDFFVLQSLDWSAIRPRAVLCEFENRKTVPLGYTWRDMAEFLAGHGYRVVVAEWYPVQRYGAVHRFRRFADYPCPLADENATGNLVAFRDAGDFERFQGVRRAFETRRFPPRFVSRALYRAVLALRRR
ncbi:MAG TPA: FkbM family methyltransferase [Longimicrobium sp.]|nr:FkbM family methyltransferase [Longimicrobium sp.]